MANTNNHREIGTRHLDGYLEEEEEAQLPHVS